MVLSKNVDDVKQSFWGSYFWGGVDVCCGEWVVASNFSEAPDLIIV